RAGERERRHGRMQRELDLEQRRERGIAGDVQRLDDLGERERRVLVRTERASSRAGRFATGEPIAKSSCDAWRPRTTATAANSAMKVVAPSARASSVRRRPRSGAIVIGTVAPAYVGTAGRVRSVGSASM